MSSPFQPNQSLPMNLIVPFFLLAPIGVIAAGLLALGSGPETFIAINAGRTVAITHALVIGWVSTMMMGACYQLGPVVLGGQIASKRLIRAHLLLHGVAIVLFAGSLAALEVRWAGFGGSLLYVSMALFLINVMRALFTAPAWSIPRAYLVASTLFLAIAATFGLTYVGNLEHHWFPITPGRLAAHAHLGLVGWIGLTLMGVSYQLIPMFNVAHRVKPRFAYPALFTTSGALVLFAVVMMADPSRDVRLLLAALLAIGPVLWAIDQFRILAGRAKRRMDIQGRATVVSLAFLGLTLVLSVGAAWGMPFGTEDEPARWPIAYAVAGIVGWGGTSIIANSYKIVPFLIWYHRYQPRMGQEPVPMIHDISNGRVAMGVLVLHSVATVVVVGGLLGGSVAWFHLGGTLLAISGAAHMVSLFAMLLPKEARKESKAAMKGAPL